MPKKVNGLDVAFCPDWAAFYKACPLSRAMLVKHNELGHERLAPERDTLYYQEKFFDPDGVGIVLSKDGVPVTGLVFRRLDPEHIENSLRIGVPAGKIGIRPLFAKLGIKRVSYMIAKQYPSTHTHMESMAAIHGCKRTVTDPDDGYLHYIDELPEDCHGDA